MMMHKYYLNETFLLSGDGKYRKLVSLKAPTELNPPQWDEDAKDIFPAYSRAAVINGIFYVFGGEYDFYAVCSDRKLLI